MATSVWFGLAYRAIAEWRHSATLLAERRTGATADLLVTALRRDMRGVYAAVLAAPWRNEFMANPVSELHGIATAFAQYPYAEVFFASSGDPAPDAMLFYSRSERTPRWIGGDRGLDQFPIAVGREPTHAKRLLDRIAHDVERRVPRPHGIRLRFFGGSGLGSPRPKSRTSREGSFGAATPFPVAAALAWRSLIALWATIRGR
jgi:hypothetical protein